MSVSAGPERPKKRRMLLRPFLRDKRGATAIEFAILALPFSALLFAILESCISFASQQLMANITDDIARRLRTGQIREAEIQDNPEKLKKMICDQLDVVVTANCPGLDVDLQSFDSFDKIAAIRVKYLNKDLDTTGFKVDPGPAMSKNLLRVFYRWPVMTDFLKISMSNLDGGKVLHFASAAWQNEPFDD